MQNLYGTYSVVVTEENKDNGYILISSCKFENFRRGICFATAG
jgi:hypothetical protein